jgi:fumarate reductase flavoprotein subunit
MGGIQTNGHTQTGLVGLFAVGECASVGIHGANRLGSNSLAELGVFGRVAGEQAAALATQVLPAAPERLLHQARENAARWDALRTAQGSEKLADLRDAMADAMEAGVGIQRTAAGMQQTVDRLAELRRRYADLGLRDHSLAFNTEWLTAIELGCLLEVAEAMAHAALARRESRGSHQRPEDYPARDDDNYLKHSLVFRVDGGPPRLDWQDVVIGRSPPGERRYGAAAQEGA